MELHVWHEECMRVKSIGWSKTSATGQFFEPEVREIEA